MNRAAKIALVLLAILVTSPIWCFEIAYRLFLPPVLPELPATTEATRFELDALWMEAGGRPSSEVTPLWTLNLFQSPRRRRPDGAEAAGRIARDWVSKVSPRTRHVRWSLAVLATTIWLSRNSSAEELKRALAEWEHFGRHTVGIKAARDAWFGCGASPTLAQEALLIGLPENPSYLNPIERPELVRRHRLQVLKSLAAGGLISREDEAKAAAEDAEATVLPYTPVCP
jgi:hypothetical protein